MTTPLGGPYSDRATVKRRAGIADSNTAVDDDVDMALLSGADTIHQYCGRQFGRTDTASVRTVRWVSGYLDTDDFWTSANLTVDGIAYVSTTYRLEPTDGVMNGVPGYPFERITRRYGTHPIYSSLSGWTLESQVSACWGWAAVPASIVQAQLLLSADHLKSKDTPFGIAGFGDYVTRVRANPKVQELLDPYRRDALKVG